MSVDLHSSGSSQLVRPGLSSFDVENSARGVGRVGLDLDDSVGLPGDLPVVAEGPAHMLHLLLLGHPQGGAVAVTISEGHRLPVTREVTATPSQ